jgi:hypothetical protein
MRKAIRANSILGLAIAVILNLLIPTSAQARIVLKIAYSSDESEFNTEEYVTTEEEWGLWTETCEVGTACAKKNRAQTDTAAKARAIKMCKTLDGYRAYIKVVTGSGSTAGLGSLNTVSILGFKKRLITVNTPDWDSDEDYPYEDEVDDPAYIEDGYEYIYWEGICRFSGSVSLISSSFYTIYVNGGRGPEYSRATLTKLKWSVSLVDN